jgi:tetratricopeptide (TPR) repeat protein
MIVVIASVLVLARPAAADADEPTAKEKKKARKLVGEATVAKDKGDKLAAKGKDEQARKQYRVAALAYLEAYSLVEHPFLLFKLAEVYRARGENEWALAGFKTYLAKDPEGPGAERAKAAEAELDAQRIADHQAGVKPHAGDAELDPTAVFDPLPPVVIEKPKPKPKPKKKPKRTIAPVERRDDDGRGHPGRTLRWSGYATAGLGVILLGAGIKYGIDASSAASSLSGKEGAWDLNDRRRIEAGEKAEKNQIIFTLLGSVALAAGSGLWLLGDRAERKAIARERRRSAALVPAGDGALLLIGGSF